jgi:hypothetical protein
MCLQDGQDRAPGSRLASSITDLTSAAACACSGFSWERVHTLTWRCFENIFDLIDAIEPAMQVELEIVHLMHVAVRVPQAKHRTCGQSLVTTRNIMWLEQSETDTPLPNPSIPGLKRARALL